MFSCDFYEISKNTFFTEHLWTTAPKNSPENLFKISFVYLFIGFQPATLLKRDFGLNVFW